jgi:hypothetical protein
MLMIEHRPWVGDRYAIEGIDGQRIAIMGYSAWTPNDHDGYTIESVRNVISGAWRNVQFFQAIARYFEMPAADFYRCVLFFEFVPCAIGGGAQRYAVATPEHAEAGRTRALRIVKDHQVQKLLVFSAKAWSSMPPMVEALSGQLPCLPGAPFRIGTYDLDGARTVAIGLRHPQYAPKATMRAAVKSALALPT